ncbi:MAG: phage major capsid protein [Burkholderiales bacterium]|nr:phage major capsid protein [Burkholderiales bacterium]
MKTVTSRPTNHLLGLPSTRYLLAMALAKGNVMDAITITQTQNWHDTPEVLAALKAAVGAMDTEDAAALLRPIGYDYAEFLRPQTIVGRLVGLRRVPFLTRVLAQSVATASYWTGESRPKPVTRSEFTGETLGYAKTASITVVSEELVKTTSPAAVVTLSRDLGRAGAQAIDEAFIDPLNAGNASKPASVTHGAPQFPSTGATVSNIDDDLSLLINSLSDAGSDLSFATWVMRPRTAISLSRLRSSSDDALAYPGITARGGLLFGLPVITSASMRTSDETGHPTSITLLDASQIDFADDGDSNLSVSTNASIQMESDPQTGAAEQVSLWQRNLIGLRAERAVNWKRRHPGVAATLTGVTY